MSDSNVIDRAFAQDKQLRKRVFDAMHPLFYLSTTDTSPQHAPLFEDIARYHLNYAGSGSVDATDHDNEPASKKRKLVNGSSASTSQPPSTTLPKQNRQVLLEARDISFSIPQRKKLHLGIARYGGGEDKSATGNTTPSTYTLFTRNPATSSIEFEVDLNQFAYALRLPVPEKATKQYNFCLLPRSTTNSTPTNTNTSSTSTVEPIIWTINHGPLKSLQISDPELTKIISDSHCEADQIFSIALNHILQTATRGNVSLTYPAETEFASAKPESHRKSDKAYHVKAFRGSKDGFLFFLENGIFFGFKKPLAFFAFDDIVSISYTSVLQRTFNLNVAYRPPATATASSGGAIGISDGDEDTVQEIEFSMLDQADFPGIDAYVKRHGLQDASLAESRRAAAARKAAAGGTGGTIGGGGGAGGVNTATSGVDDGEEEEEDTRTELEKAQQQLEDEEDELEEDYDPGSEGESDGSGGSSESDDDNDDGHDQRGSGRKKKVNNISGQNRDLVAEELGSEAEDVSITEDEEEEQEEHEDDEADPDGGEQDAVEEEEYDEEEDQDEHYDDHKNASAGKKDTSQLQKDTWAYEAGMPDPDDEDQL
ncbi:Histone chaperone [Exophiala dermatitidis]